MVRNRSGLPRAFLSRRRFARMEVNIPLLIHGFRSALLYMFSVCSGSDQYFVTVH